MITSCAAGLGCGCLKVGSVNANCPSEGMPLRLLRSKGSRAAPREAILDVNRNRSIRQKSFVNSINFGVVTFRKPAHDSELEKWSGQQYLAANLFRGVRDCFFCQVAFESTGWRELLYHKKEPSPRLMTVYLHFIYLCLSQFWLYYRRDKFPESCRPICHALHVNMVTPQNFRCVGWEIASWITRRAILGRNVMVGRVTEMEGKLCSGVFADQRNKHSR